MRMGTWVGAIAIFACAMALRLPFGSSYLWAWDSVLYARAIADFAVDQGRPHPPGYLFYVLAARTASWVVGDANAALVLVSVLAGALTCAAGYVIGRRLLGPAGGVLVAAILLTNPVLWLYSEIAYPYTALALVYGVVGALLWAARHGPAAAIMGASLALGLAAGFRQDVLLLGPLWLYVVARHGWRAVAAASAAGAAGCLAWLIPTAAQSGGLGTYVGVVVDQFVGVTVDGNPAAGAFTRNARMTLTGIWSQVLWTAPLLVVGVWASIRERRVPPALLVLWSIPPLAFYLVGHIGERAYTLALAVPLALLAAAGGVYLLSKTRADPRLLVAAGLALVLILDGRSFVLGHGRVSLQEIARHDRILAEQLRYVRANFRPAETVIVAQGNHQHAAYYLPEYTSVYLPHRRDRVRLVAAQPGARWVVLFGGEGTVRQHARVSRLVLPHNVHLRVILLRPGEQLLAEAEGLSVTD